MLLISNSNINITIYKIFFCNLNTKYISDNNTNKQNENRWKLNNFKSLIIVDTEITKVNVIIAMVVNSRYLPGILL